MKVLHIIPDGIDESRNFYLGSTKDIRGRTEYFQKRGISSGELLTRNRNRYIDELSNISEADLRQYHAVVLETTFCPSAIRHIKRISPNTSVIVRSHNAELLHRWDWVKMQGVTFKALKTFRYTLMNATRDYRSGRLADFVISISDWENNHYWSRIAPKSKLKCVPFFLPESYEALMPRGIAKKKQCVNFTSSIPNPLIMDATKNFFEVVRHLNGRCKEWSFTSTGDPSKFRMNSFERIHWTGYLESPYQVLAESRAMALLSDYGYGFKTKILEAIIAKAFVLMTEGLYKRMPDEIRSYCIPVDIRSIDSFEEALAQCEKPYPEGDPNRAFRDRAFTALDEILLH